MTKHVCAGSDDEAQTIYLTRDETLKVMADSVVRHLAPADSPTADDECQLCEEERELEPGTFTPHEHGRMP